MRVKTLVWTTYLLMVAVSVAGNVWHAYPNPKGMGIGVVVPVVLVLSTRIVELAVGLTWRLRLLVGLIAGAAFVVSFSHLRGFAESGGEGTAAAVLFPVLIDALMILCSWVLLALPGDQPETMVPDVPRLVSEPETTGDHGPEIGDHAETMVLEGVPVKTTAETMVPELETTRDHAETIGVRVPGTPGPWSPDGLQLRDRYGTTFPSQREMASDLGWGRTRVANAVREHRDHAGTTGP